MSVGNYDEGTFHRPEQGRQVGADASHAHRPVPDSRQVPFPRAIRSRASRFFRSASGNA